MIDLLARLGWSQAYLADRLGVSPKTVCGWAKGEAPVYAMRYLELCARLLNV